MNKLTRSDLLEKLKEVIHSAVVPIAAISISIPGKVFQGTLISSWKQELNGWDIVGDLAKLTDAPVRIQNDAHLFTIGYSLDQNILEGTTIVGIYYPPHSMPGVTILSDGQLIEGEKSLAGEAKFLPFLMDSELPASEETFLKNLVNLVSIYNVVIAPKYFVISAGKTSPQSLSQTLTQNETLLQQPNTPSFYFDDQVTHSIESGLFWLASQDRKF
ncbi:ROK family protein [Enterococcus sp. AZ072]|uniref:ROK family protein n=1 Tax=unclassified Enterococcus TaxID=2608891 RepID=UPI003D2C01B6